MQLTHYKTIDFRSDNVRSVCTSCTNASLELLELSAKGFDYCHNVMEQVSYHQGSALVACQVYAVGSFGDVNDIRKSKRLSVLKKHEAYGLGLYDKPGYTFINLINELANYFKHNEEWSDSWKEGYTSKTLNYYGIDESTEFPLNVGINILTNETGDLRLIAEILENWRSNLIENYT